MAKNNKSGTPKGGILDDAKKMVNIPALLTLIEDVYAVLKKDIPEVLKQGTAPSAKGCCDHGACCDAAICHILCALKCELAHKIACEAECGGDECEE